MDWGKAKISKPGLIGPARWNWVLSQIQSTFISTVVGGSWTRGPGGTALFVSQTNGSGAASHPFQVLTRPSPSEEGVTEAGVIYQSSLFNSLQPNDKFAITGLLSEDLTTGWFNTNLNDFIWLGVVFDNTGEITSASIDSSGQDDTFNLDEAAWSGNDGYCEDDGEDAPIHQTSRKLIAYTVDIGFPQPVVKQVLFSDQLLRAVCIDNRPARYPFAHEGGYPL
jgi:hypothetical protein